MTAAVRPRKAAKRCGATHNGMLAAVLSALLMVGLGSVARVAAAERVVADRHTGLAIYGVDPVAFQPIPSIFQRTREEAGVASYLVNAAAYKRSPLSLMQSTGAEYVSYIGLSDGLTHIRRLVETPGDDPAP